MKATAAAAAAATVTLSLAGPVPAALAGTPKGQGVASTDEYGRTDVDRCSLEALKKGWGSGGQVRGVGARLYAIFFLPAKSLFFSSAHTFRN